MPTLLITSAERKALKVRAHALKPVVLLGTAGLSAAVLQEIDRALSSHELIKVRLDGTDRAARESTAELAAERLSAAAVQIIGRTLILYRPRPEVEESVPAESRRPAGGERRAGALKRTRQGGASIERAERGQTTPDHTTRGQTTRGQTTQGRKTPGHSTPIRAPLKKGSIKGIVSTSWTDAAAPAPAPRTRLSQRKVSPSRTAPPSRTGTPARTASPARKGVTSRAGGPARTGAPARKRKPSTRS